MSLKSVSYNYKNYYIIITKNWRVNHSTLIEYKRLTNDFKSQLIAEYTKKYLNNHPNWNFNKQQWSTF